MVLEFILQAKPEGIEAYFDTIGYVGILIWFLTIDQLTPIPEEISLITIGYLASKGILDPIWAGIISFFSLMLVDMIYYLLSKTGNRLTKKYFQRSKSKFIESYKEKLSNHMGKTVIALCFIPRMRFWNPILIGAMNLSLKRFVIYDAIGLFAFTAIYIALGMFFHVGLHRFVKEFEGLQNVIFISCLIVYFLIILWIVYHRKKKEEIETN